MYFASGCQQGEHCVSLFHAFLLNLCSPLPTLLSLFLLVSLGIPERQFQRLWGRQGCLMMQYGFSCCASVLVVPTTLSFNTARYIQLLCGSPVIFNWHNYFSSWMLNTSGLLVGVFFSFHSCLPCISEHFPVRRRAL